MPAALGDRRGLSFLKWLYPGMHVKRWLLLLMVGIALMGLGIAYLLREIYAVYTFPDFVYYVTLQFLPRYLRAGLFFLLSGSIMVVAFWQLNRSLLAALLPAGRTGNIVDTVYQYRQLQRGPKIVAVGGGTGLSTLLRGLREHTGNLTAIVTVADDGGSSGRLRRELGVLPPGDFRNCIAALADAEPLMTRLFQYRFQEGNGLEGHSFGNLFIAAMSAIVGDFAQAIRESSRVLAVRGQILPSTLANVTLLADMEDADTIRGESSITSSYKRIRRVYLEPEDAQAFPEALRALLDADLIIAGPGSLFTSVLPNLLVDGIRNAILASRAVKVYVCNVATQRGETDGYDVAQHVEALERHVGKGLFDCVVANTNLSGDFQPRWQVGPVSLDGWRPGAIRVMGTDLVSDDSPLRHDPRKLAAALLKLLEEASTEKARGGRLVEVG